MNNKKINKERTGYEIFLMTKRIVGKERLENCKLTLEKPESKSQLMQKRISR
jgi:hypothetical protein